MKNLNVAIVGCGDISDIYLKNCVEFDNINLLACADIDSKKADEKSKKYNIKSYSMNKIYEDTSIDLIINLTPPSVHYEICLKALKSGKNIYVEKPLTVNKEEGKEILELAKKRDLFVGAAPDTFLGAGGQTCRKLIDDGWIGDIIGATAFMMNHGPESWHPTPDFFYEIGGGPMFDMGPYYLTSLINLIGPVSKVSGFTSKSFDKRVITNNKNYGEKVNVEIPTHINGNLEFENGAIGTIITSFDVWHTKTPKIEIYGTEGTLIVPDPNTFGGEIYIYKPSYSEWKEVPLSHGFQKNSRGIGVLDMAYSIQENQKNKANGNLAYHVLEIMHAFHESYNTGKHIFLKSSCERPDPLPLNFPKE